MNIYERLGRALDDVDKAQIEHLKTLGLLNEIKTGQTPIEDITILPGGTGWQRKDAGVPVDTKGLTDASD